MLPGGWQRSKASNSGERFSVRMCTVAAGGRRSHQEFGWCAVDHDYKQEMRRCAATTEHLLSGLVATTTTNVSSRRCRRTCTASAKVSTPRSMAARPSTPNLITLAPKARELNSLRLVRFNTDDDRSMVGSGRSKESMEIFVVMNEKEEKEKTDGFGWSTESEAFRNPERIRSRVAPAQTCDVIDNNDETSWSRSLEILLPATEGCSKSL
jgi:hypothetical protein